ncbi:hypothetical protein A3Q56_02108 [Intoshia linei]|uniref:Sel1 repeat family protein n=1 Tax=Intoshia linei TaxID=1819745 RepID=A0A177B987_9BILA|nr:hypothetical protein A3Q56_02108 [Intoshia linei]
MQENCGSINQGAHIKKVEKILKKHNIDLLCKDKGSKIFTFTKIEICWILCGIIGFCGAMTYIDIVYLNVVRVYAYADFTESQNILGQKYLHGNGAPVDKNEAMKWFRKAADKGHPYASFNLAYGNLMQFGKNNGLKIGESIKLIRYAAKHKIKKATKFIIDNCSQNVCDDY